MNDLRDFASVFLACFESQQLERSGDDIGSLSIDEAYCVQQMVIDKQKVKPAEIAWDMEGIGLFKNGQLAASGIGAEIMGGPMNSLRWLVNHLVRRGDTLKSGDVVISGSPVELISVDRGDRVTARFTHVDQVAAMFRSSIKIPCNVKNKS